MKATIVDLQQREIITLDRQKGIYNNGADNAYPQRVERIINNSVTAKASCDKARAFIIGEGFVSETLNEYVIYEDLTGKVTLYDLLSKVAHSISRQKAAAINVQYDGNLEVSALKHIPYRNTRIGKRDSNGYSGLIHVYSNWEKRQNEDFKPQNALKINIFNPKKEVVQAQFKDNYLGQMAMLLLDDEFVYPLAQIDPALEDADTESQIKSWKNKELRGGFFGKMIIHYAKFADEASQVNFIDTFKKFQGGDHEKSFLMIESELDSNGKIEGNEAVKLEPIPMNFDADVFEGIEKSCASNIRKSINIPSILTEQQEGSFFGSSGEAMKAAFEIYNAETRNLRKAISNWLAQILKHSADPILRNADYTIKELSYGTPLDNSGTATN
jgi:hypothetical protein